MRVPRKRGANHALLVLIIIPFLVLVWLPGVRAASMGFVWPVIGPIARGFEKPTGPYGEGGHQGVDIAASPGAVVRAAQDGKVEWIGELPRGRFISISHSGGVRTTYLDLDLIHVRRGERVRRGQVIATVSGLRDSSSPGAHLHFDTYLNGHPIDPRLLFNGLNAASYVRLCPVKRHAGESGGVASAGTRNPPDAPHQPPAQTVEPRAVGSRSGGLVERCLGSFWNGVSSLGVWIADGCRHAWDCWFYPALRGVGSALVRCGSWAWGNRYVKAVTAGFAAAVVVVIGVVIAFVLLPVSVVAAVIAGIAGALACIGMAVYYAAGSGSDLSFASCFFNSLSAGGIAAAGVISLGMLSGPLAAGWAEVGLAGTLKAAAWNGLFSAVFESGISLAFNGDFSLRRILVAFFIGALSGGIGKILKEGIFAERLIGWFSVASAGNQAGILSITESAAVLFKEAAVRFQAFLVFSKELALTLGGRAAYLAFSGSLATGLNVLTCALTHRPITLSGVLASFVAGTVMGCVALSFGGRGLNGLLSRLRVLRDGLGSALRRLVSKIANKSLSRTLKNTFETGFRGLLKEKEAQR